MLYTVRVWSKNGNQLHGLRYFVINATPETIKEIKELHKRKYNDDAMHIEDLMNHIRANPGITVEELEPVSFDDL
jgi:hypothetical protein